MKRLLQKSTNQELEFLLRGNLYESIYAKLQEVLVGKEEASFFCKIERRRTECLWYGEGDKKYQAISNLEADEKSLASELLAEARSRLTQALEQEPMLASYIDTLFLVPSDKDIFLVHHPDGHQSIAVSRWGIRSANGSANTDPLTKLINIPKPDHSPVRLQIVYSDQSPYGESSFYFFYENNPSKKIRTNNEGQYFIGKLKNGRNFGVAQHADTEPQTFIVDPSQELYSVVFPFRISFEMLVVDQDRKPLVGKKILTTYGSQNFIDQTDAGGIIIIDNLMLTNELWKPLAKPENVQGDFELTKSTTQVIFEVPQVRLSKVKILVVDQKDQSYPNYPINVKHGAGEVKSYQTDQNGEVKLPALEPGTVLEIQDGKNEENSFEAKVKETDHTFRFKVERPKPKQVKVRLIDQRRRPVQGAKLNLDIAKASGFKTTDEQGYTFYDPQIFDNGSKVAVSIQLPDAKKKKEVKRSFKYQSTQEEYTLRLRRNYWWLLLFLLPLLLLIQCEKEVHLYAFNQESGQAVVGADVSFSYTEQSLFANGQFFDHQIHTFQTQTDSMGKATFSNLSYTLFGLVFYPRTPADLVVLNHCYRDDKSEHRFHRISDGKTIEVPMEPIPVDLVFQVIDADDQQPLPDVQIDYHNRYDGIEEGGELKTDANGRFLLEGLPKCGTLTDLSAYLHGYHPDSLFNRSIEKLANDTSKVQLIALRPVKKLIHFNVVNCLDPQQKIPNALAKVEFTLKEEAKDEFWVRTNTDGVGKASYRDSLWILSRLKITVEKPYFKKGVFDQDLTVEEFMQLPDSARTICLEPEEQAITFWNTDEMTRQKLAGVTNIVTISNGRKSRSDTIISSSDGSFLVPNLISGDKLSIHAIHDPYYHPNDYTIKESDAIALLQAPAEDRVIPLKPKTFEITFWTVEKENRNIWIANANLTVWVDGAPQAIPTNSGTGEFIVEATIHSNISIKASKYGRITNDTSILNDKVSLLLNSPKSEREIPMECGFEPIEDNNQKYYLNEFELDKSSGLLTFEYYTDTAPDIITVYCGRKHNISPSNILFVYGLNGESTGNSTLTEIIPLNNCKYITIEVKGSTNWDYKVYCPK